MHVDGSHPAVVVVSPDAVQQFRPGKDPSAVRDQMLEEFVLLECHGNGLAADPDLVAPRVDHQILDLDRVRVRRPILVPEGQT